MYALSLAWRYATCRLVNLIACLTIALCVLVQVVVMAVLDGMLADYKRRVQGLGEQITLYFPPREGTQDAYEAVAEAVREVEGVAGVTPVLERYAAVGTGFARQPVVVRGIDLPEEFAHGTLDEYVLDRSREALLRAARESRDDDASAPPWMLVGTQLADFLRLDHEEIRAGNPVRLSYVRFDEEKLVRRRFRPLSRFRSGVLYYDRYFVYVPLAVAQELFGPPERREVSQAAVWLRDPLRAPALKEPVRRAAEQAAARHGAAPLYAVTAEESWAGAFEAMAHENALMEVVMFLISLSSGFAIFAILYTLVAGRVRDIGVLRSVGARRRGIVATFTLVGLLLGVVGAVAGAVGGVLLAPHINEVWEFVFRTPLYPPHLFGVKDMPVVIDTGKVILRTLAAIGLSVAATLPVAVWAGLREPLEALRHE
jgi:lipoprotein-releasing system permease protein